MCGYGQSGQELSRGIKMASNIEEVTTAELVASIKQQLAERKTQFEPDYHKHTPVYIEGAWFCLSCNEEIKVAMPSGRKIGA